MISWEARSIEERNLLNPGFCGTLLWHAAVGYAKETDRFISLEESFVVLPLVLQESIRNALPRTTRTSLTVWMQANPLIRGRIGTRSRILVPYTKDALLFVGIRGFLKFQAGGIIPATDCQRIVNQNLKNTSDEVKQCMKRATFVGRWFAQAGGPTTVLALLGVRP